jgi:hypothetical protein
MTCQPSLHVHSLRTQPGKNLSVGGKIGALAFCLGSRCFGSDELRTGTFYVHPPRPLRTSPAGPGSGQIRFAPITMRVAAKIPTTQYRDFVYLSYFFLLTRAS